MGGVLGRRPRPRGPADRSGRCANLEPVNRQAGNTGRSGPGDGKRDRRESQDRRWRLASGWGDGNGKLMGAWGGDQGARGSARPPPRWDPAPRMAGPAKSVAIDPPHANHHLRFQDTHRHFAMSRIKQPFQRPAAPPRLHCAGCCAANVSDASDPERRFTQGAAFASKRSHRRLRDARAA